MAKTPHAGDFLPGNQFWRARSHPGRNPLFDTPDLLWAACCEYFEWVDANPLWEDVLVTFQGASTHERIAKMRAMTIKGMCIFLEITERTWRNYRDRPGFDEVTWRVDAIIFTQKFEGGAAELLNPALVMRALGLSDKSELTGRDGGPLQIQRIERVIVDPQNTDS